MNDTQIANHDTEKVWELSEKIDFCMLVTRHGGAMRSRPMSTHVDRAANAFLFLTSVDDYKDDEIAKDPSVNLAFADNKGMRYLSVSGNASILNNREKIKELWSVPAEAWWDSPEDPSIRILKVLPDSAEYWESPGKIVSMIKMAAAAVSDSKPNLGDNVKVTM
jgi:general stress protein 26